MPPAVVRVCPHCPLSIRRRFSTNWNLRRHTLRVHQMDYVDGTFRAVSVIELRQFRRQFGIYGVCSNSNATSARNSASLRLGHRRARRASTPTDVRSVSSAVGAVQQDLDDVEPDDDVEPPNKQQAVVIEHVVGSPITIDDSSRSTAAFSGTRGTDESSVVLVVSSPSAVAGEQTASTSQVNHSLGGSSSFWSDLAAAAADLAPAGTSLEPTRDEHCFCDVVLGLDSSLSTPPIYMSSPPPRASTPVLNRLSSLPSPPRAVYNDGSTTSTSAVGTDLDNIFLTPPSPFRSPRKPVYEDISFNDDGDSTPLLDERSFDGSDGKILTPPSGIRWLPKNLGSTAGC